MHVRFLAAVLATTMIIVGGCSATGDLETDQPASAAATVPPVTAAPRIGPTTEAGPREVPADTPESSTGAPRIGAPASDRIVVATGGGEVYLIDPDGEQRLDLTQTGIGGHPVWSPDGRRIAWSQSDGSGFSIMSANADGTERRRAETPFAGYFGYWSPTSEALGYLGNAPPGTGLVIDSGTGSDLDEVVDSDTFYFFSWSPDGTRWVVHSGSGFSVVALDGSRRILDLAGARFRSPTWADDGSILVALRNDDLNFIARLRPDTGDIDELLEVGDVTNFVLDPTGRYLAVESVVLADGEAELGEGITVGTSSQPRLFDAEVLVYDMETGERHQVLRERTGGFWWSPDGSTLALLVEEEGQAPTFVQWLIWRPEGSFRTERFTITRMFGTAYVPFFDQFAQSVTPWSPDGTRFVYTAFDEAGEPGVFVQPARADASPRRISDDSGVAFWSPT